MVTVGERHWLRVNQENKNGDKLTYMHPSQNDQASVFGISGIPYQGHSKCYQPWPSASLVTLTLILIILDITKTKTNNNVLLYIVFKKITSNTLLQGMKLTLLLETMNCMCKLQISRLLVFKKT